MTKSKAQTIKRMDNNCHISDSVQVFSEVENGGLNSYQRYQDYNLVRQTRVTYF